MKQSPVDVLGSQNQKKVVTFFAKCYAGIFFTYQSYHIAKTAEVFVKLILYRRFVAMATPCPQLSYPKALHR